MKVVILAGGLGTRISEYTKFIPKPMIKIGKFPILIHIMRHYLKYGLNEFIVAAGYKAEILKKYFPKFKKYGLNFEHNVKGKKCIINIIHTGKNTMTGGRIKRLQYLFNHKVNQVPLKPVWPVIKTFFPLKLFFKNLFIEKNHDLLKFLLIQLYLLWCPCTSKNLYVEIQIILLFYTIFLTGSFLKYLYHS